MCFIKKTGSCQLVNSLNIKDGATVMSLTHFSALTINFGQADAISGSKADAALVTARGNWCRHTSIFYFQPMHFWAHSDCWSLLFDSLGGVSLSTNNACICFYLLSLFLKITWPQIRKHLYIHTAPVRLAAGGGAESESGVVGVVSGYAWMELERSRQRQEGWWGPHCPAQRAGWMMRLASRRGSPASQTTAGDQEEE